MNDIRLGTAVRNVCEPELERLCSYDGEEYEFSDGFESRMREIFKPKKHISIRRRIKTGLLIAAIFAAGFCLGMTNRQLWDYSTEKQDGGRMLNFNIDSVEDRKKHIEEIYTLTGLPQEFKRVIVENKSYSSVQIWMNNPDRGKSVFFDQCVPAAYREAFYAEETEISLQTENGIQYMISETPGQEYRSLVWYQYGYVFFISGELSREELMHLSRTIAIEKQ